MKWRFYINNLWEDFCRGGIGIILLGIHFYNDEMGIVLFNFSIGIVKY